MNEARKRRVEQLEILMKTVSGRERILEAYRRVCLQRLEKAPVELPMPSVIEAILEAEFGPEADEPRKA